MIISDHDLHAGCSHADVHKEREVSSLKPTKVAVIREELVALTQDPMMAVVLNQLIYWTKRVDDFDELLKEEQTHYPECNIQPRHGWIYKTAEELIDETMLNVSRQTMRRYLLTLIDKRWLEQRRNPDNPWDKTTQYRLRLSQLQDNLRDLGYSLEGYQISAENSRKSEFSQSTFRRLEKEPSKDQNLTLKDPNLNIDIITETTTEITTESALCAREDNLLAEELLSSWREATHQVNITLTEARKCRLLECFKKHFESNKDKWVSFCKDVSVSSFLMGKGPRGWVVTIDWVLDPNNLTKVLEGNFIDQEDEKITSVRAGIQGETLPRAANTSHASPSSSNNSSGSSVYSSSLSESQVRETISQIADPLWKSVCEQVFAIIGPIAFGDLFKAKLAAIDPEDKRVFLLCPSPGIAFRGEKYQFIILNALKKFYPTLGAVTAIETNEKAGPGLFEATQRMAVSSAINTINTTHKEVL